MVADGHKIVEKRWVIFPQACLLDTSEQVQPNGVDLRSDEIIQVEGRAYLPRDGKMDFSELRGRKQTLKEGVWHLRAGYHYLVNFQEYISVPEGYCATILPRSSMLRVGSFLTSALYDTGFEGVLGCSLRPINPISIQWGARLAQVIFMKADFSGHRYTGRYQGSRSQHHGN